MEDRELKTISYHDPTHEFYGYFPDQEAKIKGEWTVRNSRICYEVEEFYGVSPTTALNECYAVPRRYADMADSVGDVKMKLVQGDIEQLSGYKTRTLGETPKVAGLNAHKAQHDLAALYNALPGYFLVHCEDAGVGGVLLNTYASTFANLLWQKKVGPGDMANPYVCTNYAKARFDINKCMRLSNGEADYRCGQKFLRFYKEPVRAMRKEEYTYYMIAAVSDEPLHVVEKKNMEKSQTELMISGSDLHYIMIKVPKDSSAFRNLLNNYGLSQLFYNFL
jgi:hypothetical protein